jgi:hypothetical protein
MEIPADPQPLNLSIKRLKPTPWLGASVRNITSEGEMSAFGLPGVTGVLLLEVPVE